MARKSRKTKAERDREYAEAERRVWDEFYPRLDALQTYEGARQLVDEAPPPDSPGRRYYSNLGFFLQAFTVPGGANHTEKALYLQFIQRLDAAGALKPEAAQKIKEDLQRAMKTQGF